MAKKKKKSNPKSKLKADPSTTVEIKLPKALYDKVMDVKKTHPEVIEETLRLIFHRDDVYGMTTVNLTSADQKEHDEDEDEGIFKLCQGS